MRKIDTIVRYYKDLKSAFGAEIAFATVFRYCRYRMIGKQPPPSKPLRRTSLRESIDSSELFYFNFAQCLPILPALPEVKQPRAIYLLLPALANNYIFGGLATAIIFALFLQKKTGLDLKIICTDSEGKKEYLDKFLKDYKLDLDADSVEVITATRSFDQYFHLPIRKDDIIIATAWWTAELAEKLTAEQKFIYLIQDYETIFYPNGDARILAEQTYRMKEKYLAVVNTEILYTFLVNNGYSDVKEHGSWFEPCFPKHLFRPGTGQFHKSTEKKKLFFYARQSVPRNMFFLGINALRKAFEENILNPHEWEVYLAGEDSAEAGFSTLRLVAGLSAKNVGKMDLQTYADFASDIDLGLSLMMAPHPSYPPLEMAASGAVVVTSIYENKQDLQQYSENIICCDYSVEAVVAGIARAVEILDTRREGNWQKNNILSDWDDSFSHAVGKIAHEFNCD